MKVILFLLLGCLISYSLFSLGQIGLIIGLGLLVGFLLYSYFLIKEIHKQVTKQ